MNRWNLLLTAIVLGAAAGHCAEGGLRVYIGTYTGGKSKGIYLCDMDTSTGRLSDPKLVAETPNPNTIQTIAARRLKSSRLPPASSGGMG